MIETPRRAFPLPVLMYHDVVDAPDDVPASHRPYALAARSFREQMTALAASGVPGTRLDLHLAPLEGSGAPAQACVLTFDDGHESNYTRALPCLLEAGFRATFFVTTGWVGRAPYMSWAQIRALAEAGMEIGSHSVTHRPPSTLGPAELLAELRDSKRALEDRLGREVTSASSPTGFFNSGMMEAARASEYEALCCGRIAVWRGPDERFAIPRIPVKGGTATADVARMALGDLRIVARLRRRQLARDGLKQALGVERYVRWRRALLSSRSRQS